MKTLILTLLILTPSLLMAETFGPGTHLVTVGGQQVVLTVPAGGSADISVPTSSVTLGVPTGNPTGPDNPTPTGITAAVQAAAAAANDPKREETAAGLALVYRQGADLIKQGTITTPEQAEQWAKLGSDLALKQTGATAAWRPVRNVIGGELDNLKRRGQLQSIAAYGTAFGQVADGLAAVAGDDKAFDLAKLLELLLKLLPIILQLFGN